MHWGIQPDALIGHSLGEYVAACVAGVFSLQDALSLVLARSRLLQKVPKGAMLSVPMGKEELEPLLNDRLWLAAVNGPSQSVVSGTAEAVEELSESLAESEIEFRKIPIEVSSHSGIVAPILPPLLDFPADDRVECTPASFYLQCEWHMDTARRSGRSGILGAPSAEHCALQRRSSRAVQNPGASASGGRPGPHIVNAGTSTSSFR